MDILILQWIQIFDDGDCWPVAAGRGELTIGVPKREEKHFG
jgi:hypothetical protein